MKIDIKIDKDDSLSRKYDSTLSEVYVLDFGDNYHRMSDEPSSEFELEVRRLKGRYRDLPKFISALNVYKEWMAFLAEKHGGKDLLKRKIKAGAVDDYVPKKPRLKNIKSLKYLYKHRIIVSHVGRYLVSDEDAVNDLANEYYEMLTNNKEIRVETVDDKEADKLADELDGGIARTTTTSFADDVDYLQSYFMNKNKKKKKGKKGKKKNKKKHKKMKKDKFLISDLMKGYYDDVGDESENSPLTTYNGLLLSTGTTKEMDVYRKLSECGWDSYKIMKRANYSKRVTSLFKVSKKKKKKKAQKSNYDDLLIDIMTDNNYDDFGEFQQEMLNMTSSNVFK